MSRTQRIVVVLALLVVTFFAAYSLLTSQGAAPESPPKPKPSPHFVVASYEAQSAVALGDFTFALDEWYAGVKRGEAEAAARASVQKAAPRVVPQSFDLPADCYGHSVPAAILWRESHCNYGSVNPTGCSGSCVGMYQFDIAHWQAGGGCAYLGDWTVPANQDACADQMSRGGTNLSAWGG